MTAQTDSTGAGRSIARGAATVMAAFIISNLLGLLAKILTARAFGTSGEIDAFFAANRLSELLFNLVAGGALGSAFIPAFTALLAKDQREKAWRLASSVANLVEVILFLLCLLAVFLADPIVRYILAPGFTDPVQHQLTVTLLRLLLPSAMIFGLSGLVMGILNGHRIFLFPALAPALYSIGWIIGAVVLAPVMGIYGLAWGTILGALLHLGIQIPVLMRLPERKYRFSFGLNNPDVREVGRLMAPRLLGVAVVQLNFVLNTIIASQQPEGSITGISLAFPVMMMPQAAIAQSVAIAALPAFSAQVALGKLDEMRVSLARSLRGVLLLAIPASVGLIVLRTPIVALLYQRGEFSAESTRMVAWALLWYAAGLIGHCVVEVTARAFYALHDTKTPVIVGALAMTLNLGFSILFSSLFSQAGLPAHGGLALANSAATFLEMAGLLYLMRKKLNGIEGRLLWNAVIPALISALVMGGALLGWINFSSHLPVLATAAGGIVLGGAIILILYFRFRVREVSTLFRMGKNQLDRRFFHRS